jgi:hypothetical protein
MKVFFPTYGGGHVNAIIPIVKKLIGIGIEPIVLALTTSVFELDKQGISYFKISDFLYLYSEEEKLQINYFGIQNSLGLSNNKLSKQDTIDYLGINIFDLSITDGHVRADEKYKLEGRNIFFPLDFASRVLNEIKPDCVFVTCGQRMEKAMAVEACEKNIKVFRLVDLLGENTIIDYPATVFVMNEISRANIVANNINVENVVITGNPNFDYTPQFNNPKNLIYNHQEGRLIVSIFTQPGILGLNEDIGNIYSISSAFENITFILKPHPSESASTYERFASNNFVLLDDVDANVIIEQSSLVVTFFSSVGFQAISQDKPLLLLNFTGKDYPLNYDKYGCALKITNLIDFENFLVLFSQNRFDFTSFILNYKKLKQPKQSADKIVSYIN